VVASLPECACAQVELHSLQLRAGQPVPDTILSPVEKRRAAAFRSCAAARSFVAGRLLCRTILGRATGCAPQALTIALSSESRPYLPDHPDIDFNLSRTADTIALAVSRNGRVGLDIERPERLHETEIRGLAPLVLSMAETAALQQLPAPQRPAAFFELWVGKEAVLKCRGRGLLDDPRHVTADTSRTTGSKCGDVHHLHAGVRLHQGREPGYVWAVATECRTDQVIIHYQECVNRLCVITNNKTDSGN
jgi:4'-phosphopantetheinyl transferase